MAEHFGATARTSLTCGCHVHVAVPDKESGIRVPLSDRARKRAEARVMREVSEALGNTPAVCRSSYVDPRLVEAYRGERTIAPALKRAERLDGDDARAVLEKACARLLSRS
jgi:DNA topoisomerase IB